jgi:hypothetical protein
VPPGAVAWQRFAERLAVGARQQLPTALDEQLRPLAHADFVRRSRVPCRSRWRRRSAR